MYAYCFNNPVNLDDHDGNWPKWLENAASAIGKKAKDVVTKVKKQISSINWGRVADKAIQTIKAVTNNVEISAGIGLGLMAEANVADLLGVGLGVTYNLAQVTLDDGAVFVEQSSFVGLSGRVIFFDLFPNAGEQSSRKFGKDGSIGEFILDNSQNWTVLDASAYLFAGGSVYIGFDVVSFSKDFDRIFFYD